MAPPKGKAKGKAKATPAAPVKGPFFGSDVKRTLFMGLLGFAVAGIYSLGAKALNDDQTLCRLEEMLGWADDSQEAPADAGHPEGVYSGTAEHNATMLWGTYRPQVYFGMRTREHQSFLFGMGWGVPGDMRYTAEDDADVSFGWRMHDGVRSGVQTIHDKKNGVTLTTSFIKDLSANADRGGGWNVRIKGTRFKGMRQHSKLTVSPVFATELADLMYEAFGGEVPHAEVMSSTKAAGRFKVRVVASQGAESAEWDVRTRKAAGEDEWKVVWYDFKKTVQVVGGETRRVAPVAGFNQVSFSQTFTGDFTIEISLTPEDGAPQRPLSGCRFARHIQRHDAAFNTRFESLFDRSPNEVEKFALSNMIGGIGYWYGTGVRERGGVIAKQELYSGVPSRAKFPRGFLWDEGFHQLLIGKWNAEISKDVMLSWVNQMEPEGWIPREQIRGPEPRSRVPDQFVAQSSSIANPPTMLLQLQNFAVEAQTTADKKTSAQLKDFCARIYPYMKRWHQWFKNTQHGASPHTYRWRGKSGYHLLSCGLDDYPRSKCNTDDERHVDLHSWMILMTETMHSLASFLGETDDTKQLAEEREALTQTLMEYHWNEKKERFADFAGCPPPRQDKDKKQEVKPRAKHTPHIGYISLFPLLCGALDAEKDKDKILAIVRMTRTELLSDHGIRSLSEKSLRHWPKHDNYWTGPIWVNLNYMFSRALTQYGYNKVAPEVEEFRVTLNSRITNMIQNEFSRTRKVWENYNATSGHGRGTAPFTGWTSLFILMNGK